MLSISRYDDKIYDGISPFNKPSDLWFNLTQQSTGGNEYGKSGHFSICHFFEALHN